VIGHAPVLTVQWNHQKGNFPALWRFFEPWEKANKKR
jgi:hypothetical protein